MEFVGTLPILRDAQTNTLDTANFTPAESVHSNIKWRQGDLIHGMHHLRERKFFITDFDNYKFCQF